MAKFINIYKARLNSNGRCYRSAKYNFVWVKQWAKCEIGKKEGSMVLRNEHRIVRGSEF